MQDWHWLNVKLKGKFIHKWKLSIFSLRSLWIQIRLFQRNNYLKIKRQINPEFLLNHCPSETFALFDFVVLASGVFFCRNLACVPISAGQDSILTGCFLSMLDKIQSSDRSWKRLLSHNSICSVTLVFNPDMWDNCYHHPCCTRTPLETSRSANSLPCLTRKRLG